MTGEVNKNILVAHIAGCYQLCFVRTTESCDWSSEESEALEIVLEKYPNWPGERLDEFALYFACKAGSVAGIWIGDCHGKFRGHNLSKLNCEIFSLKPLKNHKFLELEGTWASTYWGGFQISCETLSSNGSSTNALSMKWWKGGSGGNMMGRVLHLLHSLPFTLAAIPRYLQRNLSHNQGSTCCFKDEVIQKKLKHVYKKTCMTTLLAALFIIAENPNVYRQENDR